MNWRSLFIALLLAGCQATDANRASASAQQILVTFAATRFDDHGVGGLKQRYRGTGLWQASLHLRQQARRVARRYGLVEVGAWPIESLGVYCVVYEVSLGRDVGEVLMGIETDGTVRHAQRMNEFDALLAESYDDPFFDVQYGEFRKAVERLHAISRAEGVRIGIIDTAVDGAHPDLDGQIETQRRFVDSSSVTQLLHGTAVAGVIAARPGNGVGVVGLAPDARVFVYGACRHSCTTFALAQALDYAIRDRVEVLNLSLAGPDDRLLEDLLEHAIDGGMTIVAAEHPDDETKNFPAKLGAVFAVSGNEKRWFAPGEQFSTKAGGGYRMFTGSSISAAGVSAVAALLRSLRPELSTNVLLRELLDGRCNVIGMPDCGVEPGDAL